jgi:hypothetical protein
MFVIEDEVHAEMFKEKYPDLHSAMDELTRLSQIPYGEKPNIAPCEDWRTCERNYVIIEYDDTEEPWKKITEHQRLTICPDGVSWD